MLAGPPCNTFTNARKDDGQGPKPLRSAQGPERYGLCKLKDEDVNKVKQGNLFAERTCEAVEAMDDLQRPSVVEQPKYKEEENAVSMYKLDEFASLRSRPTVEMRDIVQCHYGAPTTKPTSCAAAWHPGSWKSDASTTRPCGSSHQRERSNGLHARL